MPVAVSTLRRIRDVSGPPRSELIPSSVLGMLIFVCTEVMLFAGFVSAYTILRAGAVVWPPPGQPRLPVEETAGNTALLLASGAALWMARRRYRPQPRRARPWLIAAIALGAGFVGLQGREWVQLIAQGLTLTSSALGSFFYLIVGAHALHAVAALGLLAYAWRRLEAGWLPSSTLATAEVLWYFVVGVWPILYWRVYL
jgi:cytochrome c oxidase subunit 3